MSGLVIERHIEIARLPGDVFDFLADTRGFKAVDPALVDYEPEGRLVEGMTGRMLHRRAGLPARTTWKVTTLRAPSRVAVEIQGMGYGMTEVAELEATASGTRVRFVDRVWPTTLPGRVLVALSGGVMRRDLRARAARLKAILEAGESIRSS